MSSGLIVYNVEKLILQRNKQCLGMLPKVVTQYNFRIHRTTVYKPIDDNEKNEKTILEKMYTSRKIQGPGSFVVGDKVRVSKH